ncbi:hypothetical protein [Agrobacterium tumefaciens]|uniref:hypothetical protein n=1 Tax=Agrobacterium tumefaciens TaxID=358 RepID=UPI0021CE72CE|nr:hypothetical protein [Agrobacterium tumefaciens]UXS01091.1 hypothetical protein FY156_06075 [Agrobacterium tumefaciens]
MVVKLANNAISTLAASITDAVSSLSVQGADAGKFPPLDAGDWHPATIIDPAGNMEIVKVTARVGAVLTIERAQEGTTAKAFAAGSRVDIRLTAGAFLGALSGKVDNSTFGDVVNDLQEMGDDLQQLGDDLQLLVSGNAGKGLPSYVKGLVTSRPSAYLVSVTSGEIKGNGKFTENTAAFSKRLDAVWAAGAGNGGRLSAAAIAASTTYHLHALRKDSDGSFDWGFDVSATAPTVPVGYSWVGRFWSVYTNSAANGIVAYTQADNFCITSGGTWFVSTSALALGLYSPPVTIPVPSGIKVRMRVAGIADAAASGNTDLQLYHAETVPTALADLRAFAGVGVVAASTNDVVAGTLITNTARQVGILLAFNGAGGTGTLVVVGWEDFTLNRIY